MARVVAVPVSLLMWQDMVTEGWQVGHDGYSIKCVEGVPEGAEIVSSCFDVKTQSVRLVLHHSSFSDIPVGGQIPVLVPKFHKIKNGTTEEEG